MARAFGLPAEAALRAITLSPAEIFGVADRAGLARAGQGRQPVRGHGRHHGPPHSGDPRLHRRRGQSLETRHTRLYEQFKDAPLAHAAPSPAARGAMRSGAGDALGPHVGAQGLGDHHRAVRLLVVLQDGDERAPHGQAAAVQGVQEARLGLGLRPVAEARRGGPGSRCSSSRTRSRGRRPGRAARPRGRRSWPSSKPMSPVESTTTR